MDFKIRRVKKTDVDPLNKFFVEVITHTFKQEGAAHLQEDIKDEIQDKLEKLDKAFNGHSSTDFFVAETKGQIIGTISVNPRGDFSKQHLPLPSEDILEIACLYIKPTFQSMGVGKLLLNYARSVLKDRGYQAYILDSGYKNAQKVWEHLLGKPEKVLINFWGNDTDHMFWYKRL